MNNKTLSVVRALTAGLVAAALALSTSAGSALAQVADRDPALQQTVTADEQLAPAGEEAVIDAGHADLGAMFIDDALHLMVRDDTQVPPVWRDLDDVVFKVGEEALQTLPEGDTFAFTGATAGQEVWVIPQQEVAGVPWLGWNTQSPALLEKATSGMSLEFGGHEGPGNFSLFVQPGGFSEPQQLWNAMEEGAQPMWVEPNTHTHANWVFTDPGVHLVGIRAVVKDDAGQLHEAESVVRLALGDATVEQARAAEFSGPWRTLDAESQESSAAGDQGGISAGVIILLVGVVVVGALVLLLVARTNRARKQAVWREKKDN